MKIYVIYNGNVSQHITDPNFNQYLPVIPSEVKEVNFTWRSGPKKYYYTFDRLLSLDENILEAPKVSIKTKGRVPKEQKRKLVIDCSAEEYSGSKFINNPQNSVYICLAQENQALQHLISDY